MSIGPSTSSAVNNKRKGEVGEEVVLTSGAIIFIPLLRRGGGHLSTAVSSNAILDRSYILPQARSDS